jgi:hypothetical protein
LSGYTYNLREGTQVLLDLGLVNGLIALLALDRTMEPAGRRQDRPGNKRLSRHVPPAHSQSLPAITNDHLLHCMVAPSRLDLRAVSTESRDWEDSHEVGLASKNTICPHFTSTFPNLFVPGNPTSSPLSTGYNSSEPPQAGSHPLRNDPLADGSRGEVDVVGADGGELGR